MKKEPGNKSEIDRTFGDARLTSVKLKGTSLVLPAITAGIIIAILIAAINIPYLKTGQIEKDIEVRSEIHIMGNALEAAKLYMETSLAYSTYQACYDTLRNGGWESLKGKPTYNGYAIWSSVGTYPEEEEIEGELKKSIKSNLELYRKSPYRFMTDYLVNIPAYEVDVVMYQPYQLSVGAWNNSNFWIEKMQESGERIRLEKYGFLQGEYSIDCYGIYAKGLEAFSSARSVVDRAIEETNPPEQITATSEEELGRKLSEINKTFIEKAKTGLHKLSETGVDYDISVDVQKINLLWTEKSHEVFQGGVKSELEFIPDVKVRFDITNTRDDQTFPVYDGERVVMSPLTLVFVFSYSPEELMKEAAVLEYNTKLLAFVSYDSNGNVIDTEPCYEKSYCEMLFYAMVQEEPDIKTDAGYVPVSLVKPEIPVPGTDNLRRIVSANAMRNSLQRDMVFALVHKESGWNPNLVSPSGAVGLMQLLPSTAEGYGWDKTRESLFDPDVNSRCGTNYLRFLIDKFGDERIALAAYNYGYGNLKRLVNRYGSDYSKIRKRLPIETRQLVDYVMTFRRDYAAYLKQTEAVV